MEKIDTAKIKTLQIGVKSREKTIRLQGEFRGSGNTCRRKWMVRFRSDPFLGLKV